MVMPPVMTWLNYTGTYLRCLNSEVMSPIRTLLNYTVTDVGKHLLSIMC